MPICSSVHVLLMDWDLYVCLSSLSAWIPVMRKDVHLRVIELISQRAVLPVTDPQRTYLMARKTCVCRRIIQMEQIYINYLWNKTITVHAVFKCWYSVVFWLFEHNLTLVCTTKCSSLTTNSETVELLHFWGLKKKLRFHLQVFMPTYSVVWKWFCCWDIVRGGCSSGSRVAVC